MPHRTRHRPRTLPPGHESEVQSRLLRHAIAIKVPRALQVSTAGVCPPWPDSQSTAPAGVASFGVIVTDIQVSPQLKFTATPRPPSRCNATFRSLYSACFVAAGKGLAHRQLRQ